MLSIIFGAVFHVEESLRCMAMNCLHKLLQLKSFTTSFYVRLVMYYYEMVSHWIILQLYMLISEPLLLIQDWLRNYSH